MATNETLWGFTKGDRVRLVRTPDDPYTKLQVGIEGTVNFLNDTSFLGEGTAQIGIAWDNGSSLMLVMPDDHGCAEVIR